MTGFRKKSKIHGNIKLFLTLFSILPRKTHFKSLIIDNMSANGSFGKPLFNCLSVAIQLAKTLDVRVFFSLKFPGVSIKTDWGTVILFQSGNFNIVGMNNNNCSAICSHVLKLLEVLAFQHA
jgi:hypothetical protein